MTSGTSRYASRSRPQKTVTVRSGLTLNLMSGGRSLKKARAGELVEVLAAAAAPGGIVQHHRVDAGPGTTAKNNAGRPKALKVSGSCQ